MNELQIFESQDFGEIRTVSISGEPWFVGRDVAEALGYKNSKDALNTHVDTEDRQLLQRSDFATLENHIPKSAFPVNFVNGEIPNRGLTIINESGVYALVFGSKLESAKAFKRWITHDVIPAIRKTGGYIAGEERMSDDELLSQALLVAQRKLEARTAELNAAHDALNEANAALDEAQPKVIFADAVAAAQSSILIGDLAKLLRQNGVQIGQKRLFEWLRNNGYLMKYGESYNMPTQKSMERKLFEIKVGTYINPDGSVRVTKTTKVSGKGQQYFINLFLNEQNKNKNE